MSFKVWRKLNNLCFTSILTVQQCPDPGEVVNGARSVRPETGFAVGTLVRFSCNQGYQLEGPSQISCHGRDTGTPKWSDRSPKCVCKSLYCTFLLPFLLHFVVVVVCLFLAFFGFWRYFFSCQWNMIRAQILAFPIMATRPCTSTVTRQGKLCVSSVTKAMNLLVRSLSAVFQDIPLSGTTHHHFAKVVSMFLRIIIITIKWTKSKQNNFVALYLISHSGIWRAFGWSWIRR